MLVRSGRSVTGAALAPVGPSIPTTSTGRRFADSCLVPRWIVSALRAEMSPICGKRRTARSEYREYTDFGGNMPC